MEKKSFITRLAILSVTYPAKVIAIAIIAILVSIYSTLTLEIHTSNLDLIDSDNLEVRKFLNFAEKFGNPNTLLVVFEGNQEQSLALASQAASNSIELIPEVHRVISRIPTDPIAFLNNERITFYTNNDGTAYFIFIQPKDIRTQVAAIEPLIKKIRLAVDKSMVGFPEVSVGYTGIPQYALDDQNIIQKDLSYLSVLSLILVLLLFIFTFHEIKGPILATASLLIGVILTLGFVSYFPGHLTLLSAPFAMMLFGLGIDYGVHILTHLEHLLINRDRSYEENIVETMSTLGRSLLSACGTTIIVFLILLFSGFKGFRELGLIAAVGMAFCCLTMFTVFPALLTLLPIKRRLLEIDNKTLKSGIYFATRSYASPVLIVICLLSLFLPSPNFDSNYLNLQPKKSETVRLERMITDNSKYSPYFAAFVLKSEEDVSRISDLLKKNPLIGEVRSITEIGEFSKDGLPPTMLKMFKSDDGEFAVYAFPNKSIWDQNYEKEFLNNMRSISQEVTGLPFVGNTMINKTKAALKLTERLALIFVALIVLLDFRNLLVSIFVMVAPISAMLLMQSFMRLTNIPYNPLNIMALPIILGIAVDYSIYVAHRFIQESGDLHKALAATGKSLLLTTLTTLASFGTLCFTSHLGLRSFGIILSFGISVGFLLSVSVLPWLLVRFKHSILKSA